MNSEKLIKEAELMIEDSIIKLANVAYDITYQAAIKKITAEMFERIRRLAVPCNCPACQIKKELENLARTSGSDVDTDQIKNILEGFSTKNTPDRSVEELLSAVGIEPKKYRRLEPSGCQCPACKIVDEMIEKNDAEITPKSAGPIEMVYDVKVPIKTEPEGRGFMYVLQEKLKATDVKVSAYNIHLDEEENPVAVSFEMILPSKRG